MLKRVLIFLLFIIVFYPSFAQNTLVRTADDVPFRQGLELLDREKYSAAREFFQRYINENRNDSRTIDAEYYVALSALNLFNPDAEELFKNFLFKYPYHAKSTSAYYDLGNFYYSKQKFDKAIEYLEKVDTKNLSSTQKLETKFKLAYSYFSKQNFEKAGPLFDEVKTGENKYTYAASYYAGYIEFKNGNNEAALGDLRKAELNNDYKAIVPLMIVNVYYKMNALDELIAYSEDVLANRSDIKNKDEIFLLSAEAYYRKHDYKKAAELFKKHSMTGKPSNEVTYRMALSEYKIKDYTNAISDFKFIASLKDSLGQSAAYYLGLSYLMSNNKEFALAAFDQSRRLNFSKATREEALFNYAKVNFDLKRYNEAIPPLKEFSQTYPESKHTSEVNELLSEAYIKSNNHSEAISYIESLKTRTPRINAAYQQVTFLKGVEYFNNLQNAEAIKMFDKSASFPVDKDLYVAAVFWKGEAQSLNKDYENSLATYSEVLRSAPAGSDYAVKSHYGMGYAYYNTKQFDKAIPHFREFIKNSSSNAAKRNYDDALIRLADLYYVTKDYDQALKYYDQAIAGKGPDVDYAYYQKGLVLGLMDKVSEAKSNFDIVTRQYPGSLYYDDAVFQKAQLDFQNGSYQSAADQFSYIIKNKPTSAYVPYALLKRALAYGNLNNYSAAVKDYETILTDYPSHTVANDALLGLKDALTQTDKLEEFPKWVSIVKEANPGNGSTENIEFETAKSLYFSEKYKAAIDNLDRFIKTYPESSNKGEAEFLLAESYYRINDVENALKYYRGIAAKKEDPNYTKAIQRIAELSYRQKAYDEAKNYYMILLSNARNKRERTISWLGLMESYYNIGKYDSSAYYANEIIVTQGNPTVDAANKANLYLGKSAYAKGELDAAVDFFLNTLNSAKDENGAEAQFLIGEIQYKQKKYKQSLESLYNLNKTFAIYPGWIDRSFLLIADNFIAMNEIFQAKATLNSIIEKSKDKDTVEKARQKLTELEGKEKGNNE
jgi:TolA-binding protein